MKSLYLLLLGSLFLMSCTAEKPIDSPENVWVDGQIIHSKKLPPINIGVANEFKYIGKFAFEIDSLATGERFVFADADQKNVRRLIIFQFEQFLPTTDEIYRYSFDNALVLGNHKFKQNTFAYSNAAALRNSPNREGALTATFLTGKGFSVEDEFMLSRYVTLGNADRKSELIIFYIENASTSGHSISEFYDGDDETEIWQTISAGLNQRALASFTVSE